MSVDACYRFSFKRRRLARPVTEAAELGLLPVINPYWEEDLAVC
jgi:hypothetical protein